MSTASKGCQQLVKHETNLVLKLLPTQGRQRPQGFLPQLDEFYFTTAEKKLLENCRCIVLRINLNIDGAPIAY
jgi:hypothetical protein